MGRGTLFGVDVEVISSVLISFFLLWVLWGLVQYWIEKGRAVRSRDSSREGPESWEDWVPPRRPSATAAGIQTAKAARRSSGPVSR